MKFKVIKSKDNTFRKLGKDPEFREHAHRYKKRIDLSVVIFEKRKELKFSQSKLAEKLGITQRIISNIEQGNYNPGFDMMVRIAEALKLDFSFGQAHFTQYQQKPNIMIGFVAEDEKPNPVVMEKFEISNQKSIKLKTYEFEK